MIFVLTGGTGMIGNALGQRLVREGHEVRILSRNPQAAGPAYPARIFAWSGGKAPAPKEAFQGVDVVVHLAGENIAGERWTSARKKLLRDSRIDGVEGLRLGLEAAGCKPKVFISASGVGVYGDRGEENLSERSTPGADFLAELCQQWEQAAAQVAADRHVQARFGVVFGPQGGFLRQVVPLFNTAGASRLGNGRQWFSWIHIEDLVESVMLMIRDERLSGPVNVVSPEPVTNADVTRELRRVLKASSAPPVPKIALQLLYGELSQALLGSQRVVPETLTRAGFKWKFPRLDAALDAILPGLAAGEMRLVFEIWLPAPVREVWPFFSSEHNLERLTPPFLGFHVLNKSTPEIKKGTLINYRLSLRGLPLRWRTLITEWKVNDFFTDEQVHGPYKTWKHLHKFEEMNGGTLMRDSVVMKPPMGRLGRIFSLPFILRDVEGIFQYRTQVIREIYAPEAATKSSPSPRAPAPSPR